MNRQWQYCTCEETSPSTIFYWRQNLRGNVHGPPDDGEHTHRNVVL